MKRLATIFTSFLLFILLVGEVQAIIILPAVILVPIVKIVAILISGFSLPIVGITTYLYKISNKPLLKGVFVSLLILIVIGVITSIILKMVEPSRPLF